MIDMILFFIFCNNNLLKHDSLKYDSVKYTSFIEVKIRPLFVLLQKNKYDGMC